MFTSSHLNNRSEQGSEQGAAFLELALLLPLLLLLMFGTYELTVLMRGIQLMQSITKEAGREAYRECSAVPVSICPSGDTTMDACLLQVQARQANIANVGQSRLASFLGEIELVVSAYREEDVSGTPTLLQIGIREAVDCDVRDTCSRFSEASVRADTELSVLTRDKGTLMITEVFAQYNPVFEGFIPAGWTERQYYVRAFY